MYKSTQNVKKKRTETSNIPQHPAKNEKMYNENQGIQ